MGGRLKVKMRMAIAFALIFLIGYLGMSYMHEEVHVQIYRSYGIDSEILLFEAFPHFATRAEEPCSVPECNLAHNINEAITYTLQFIYLIIGFGLITIILILEGIFEKT